MKKLLSILVPFALVLSACGSNTTPAATVNGDIITVGDVESLMGPAADPADPEAPEGAVDQLTFAQFLTASIQLDIFFDAAEEEFGINPTDEEVMAEADRIFDEAAVGQTREEFLESEGISEELLQLIARQSLVHAAVVAEVGADVEPTEEDLDDARQAAAFGLAEVCASHILVETEEEANEVLTRLDDGEDFADLAEELSLDTGSGANGGDLDCAPPTTYVDPFAEATMSAEIGVVTEPVESEFGFHLILVTDRTEADPADLPSDAELTEQMTPVLVDEAFQEWFTGIVAAADVTVEPEFGTWDEGPPAAVIPPDDGSTDTTTGGPTDTTTAE